MLDYAFATWTGHSWPLFHLWCIFKGEEEGVMDWGLGCTG